MKFNKEIFNEALTMSILEELEKRDIIEGKFAPFARKVLGKKDSGKTFRLLRNGKQKWNIEYIYNVAKYFNENLSMTIARAEIIYTTRQPEIAKNLEEKKVPQNTKTRQKSTK